MQVRFTGGPLDGETKEIGSEPEVGRTIHWPPDATPTTHDDTIPGADDILEYLYRGDGEADYVAGLLNAEASAREDASPPAGDRET